MARSQLGPAPAADKDGARYGDILGWFPTPQVGSYLYPFQMMGGGAATALASGNSGQITYTPLVVPRAGMSFDQLAVGTTVAQSGGTTTCTLAVYPSLADGSGPFITNGPIVSGNITLTATAGTLTTSISWSPAVGLYWAACFYRETSAPTTRASIYMVQNSAPTWTSATSAVVGASGARYMSQAGQTALSTTQPGTFGAGSGTTAPVVALHRSA